VKRDSGFIFLVCMVCIATALLLIMIVSMVPHD